MRIKALSEQEASPMPSAMSPNWPVYQTDAEMCGSGDRLLKGSSILDNRNK